MPEGSLQKERKDKLNQKRGTANESFRNIKTLILIVQRELRRHYIYETREAGLKKEHLENKKRLLKLKA